MMRLSDYDAPGTVQRLSREIPGYVLMRMRNRFAAPVVLPQSKILKRVVLFPGLTASPASMGRLSRSLRLAGCEVYDWGQGRNMGFRPDMIEALDKRIRDLSADGVKLTLIGWSMGGLIARELAKTHAIRIEQVVTLGSPFSGDIMRNNNAVRTYELFSGHLPSDVPFADSLAEKPSVRTVAIWSARDGVVAPGAARGQAAESDLSVEVKCAHMSYASCPNAIRAVAEIVGITDGEDRAIVGDLTNDSGLTVPA